MYFIGYNADSKFVAPQTATISRNAIKVKTAVEENSDLPIVRIDSKQVFYSTKKSLYVGDAFLLIVNKSE